VEAIHRVRQPFNVNAMGLEAALAALADEAHVIRTRHMVVRGLRQLETGFRNLKLNWVPSAVNFVLVKVGDGRRVFEALERKGVIVRAMDGYGLPEFIRVTVGTRAENRRFLEALGEVLNTGR
jgi:histidinol-phosphate aminotransferase